MIICYLSCNILTSQNSSIPVIIHSLWILSTAQGCTKCIVSPFVTHTDTFPCPPLQNTLNQWHQRTVSHSCAFQKSPETFAKGFQKLQEVAVRKLLLGKGRGWTEQSTGRQMISREMHCLKLLSGALLTLCLTVVPIVPRLTERSWLWDISFSKVQFWTLQMFPKAFVGVQSVSGHVGQLHNTLTTSRHPLTHLLTQHKHTHTHTFDSLMPQENLLNVHKELFSLFIF